MWSRFFVCPDNTAHLVLEQAVSTANIPGLHIAQVVCKKICELGFSKVGLLGTDWTMSGTTYADAFDQFSLSKLVPPEPDRQTIHELIFDELCQGHFRSDTISYFINQIDKLKQRGAECVVLGCTEIPLIVTKENSPLPILDSTRLLAEFAVRIALSEMTLPSSGWIDLDNL